MAKDKAGFHNDYSILASDWLIRDSLWLAESLVLKTKLSEPTEIYSELAEEYFKTPPKDRTSIIEKIINEK